MLRFLRHILLFLTMALLSYVILIIVWGELMPERFKKNLNYPIGYYGHMFSRIKEIPKHKDPDILFLGASHAYRGLDTRIFAEHGYNCFNLGSSGQSPVQTKILVERYLDSIQPKLIVYEVTSSTFTSDGIESSLDLIANDRVDERCVKMALQLNDIKTYNTLIYGSFRQLMGQNDHFTETAVKNDDTYIPGGFVEKKMSYNRYATPADTAKFNWKPKQYQFTAFEEVVSIIREKHIPFILIQSPLTHYLYKRNKDNDKIDAYFSGKGSYYNFNKLVDLDDSLNFYDDSHLNQSGVRIFNEAIIKDAIEAKNPGPKK